MCSVPDWITTLPLRIQTVLITTCVAGSTRPLGKRGGGKNARSVLANKRFCFYLSGTSRRRASVCFFLLCQLSTCGGCGFLAAGRHAPSSSPLPLDSRMTRISFRALFTLGFPGISRHFPGRQTSCGSRHMRPCPYESFCGCLAEPGDWSCVLNLSSESAQVALSLCPAQFVRNLFDSRRGEQTPSWRGKTGGRPVHAPPPPPFSHFSSPPGNTRESLSNPTSISGSFRCT
ncbi:hypothetical protein LX32DRAFT_188930 [Colletotrichum zoysiae]|uniref:Uncharacterized protein n=1 Tax=Colletotrichum zoysiae TaxID=1216348 RepID=A0AAD9M344_9PEZI|nr:hypothetical protein LX32DRAFT_188930 [Colletotrichum zoysiae]